MIVKLFFIYGEGSDDEIILTADDADEMNKLIDYELNKRGAIYTGHEVIEA